MPGRSFVLAMVSAMVCASQVGCLPTTSFACDDDPDCGEGGVCVGGLCAREDDRCASGTRYGDAAGSLSGQCTGVDGGAPADDGGADGGAGAAHDVCLAGARMSAATGPCVEAICEVEPSCCSSHWGVTCIRRVATTEACGPQHCAGMIALGGATGVTVRGAGGATLWESPPTDAPAYVLAWGDYDVDGDADLFVGTNDFSDGAKQLVYRNDGEAIAGALELVEVWSSDDDVELFGDYSPFAAAWGDHDGDGDLDLAYGGSFPGVILLRNDGDDDFSDATDEVAAVMNVLVPDLMWGDLDDDGDLDLAVAGYEDFDRVLINSGDGTFGDAWVSSQDVRNDSVAWGDLAGDGALDLAASGDSFVHLYERDPPGGLSATPITLLDGVDTQLVAWADLDDDGSLDLVTGGYGQPVNVYRNVGGALDDEPAWSSEETTSPDDLVVDDLDDDGDLDVAACGVAGSVLFVNESGAGKLVLTADVDALPAAYSCAVTRRVP